MANTNNVFNTEEWCGEWESFEHYIESKDRLIDDAWGKAEQAVLSNPRMAPMAARGIRAFWAMACTTTSPENTARIGSMVIADSPHTGQADDDGTDDVRIRIVWKGEDGSTLAEHDYHCDHVMAKGLEGAPTFVFEAVDGLSHNDPFHWLLAIAPLPKRAEFSANGGLLSHFHFQYASDLATLIQRDEQGAERLLNQRWYATMCACEGTSADRAAIVLALHHAG
ncbi:hypothetical protein [Bifidobacterium oedipodis]|uniref:Uncharacterized protein n=1 Tax=Bifidobacterium oedipodis TaxID=2675322 RepID=A0A7Y0ES15_9BIFI|nr:hypothetical protein [Bifidobacterium sp. DSM 109957]NMM94271.1 hypothetical protein [Bifidobacterium sp. DSM 109957]